MEVSNARTPFNIYDHILSCILLAKHKGRDVLISEKA